MSSFAQVHDIANAIQQKLPSGAKPKVGIVLGSGWADYADQLEDSVRMSYLDLGLPVSQVVGHYNHMVYGKKNGAQVLIMQGRIHFYEGYDLKTVVWPIRTLIASGCNILIITNAAGGINPKYHVSQLALISDHINLMEQSPLWGPNDAKLGTRFPDMTNAYDPALRALAQQVAQEHNIALGTGVYAGLAGPQYETPAEIHMLRCIGADLVGMSTVPEVIAARHMGARVLGISCVTNLAAGLSAQPLSHEEVSINAASAKKNVIALINGILTKLARVEA